MRHALVLAGGSGTRLWPLSTRDMPKQVVPLLDGRSLLELAIERAHSLVNPARTWIGTGEALAVAIGSLPGIDAERVVVEPSGRDTLPALTFCMARIARADPDAVVAVLTADHVIEPLGALTSALDRGFAVAEAQDDVLVAFGVVPDQPATSFGYLELGEPLAGDARRVSRYAEKPQAARAAQLVEQGALWNSGMFVWRAATFLRAVAAFAPDTLALVERVLAGEVSVWDAIPRVSVDYGVMEPASTSMQFTVAALPLTAQWLDVGSWPQLGDALGRATETGNAVGAAAAELLDSRGCVVVSSDPDHLVALIGCDGLVVVHTAAATLVVPAAQAQRVKELQALVAADFPELA